MDLNNIFFEKRNKTRNYLHFDKKISSEKLYDYISNSENIKKHSFYPFISYKLNERKIKKNNGNLIVNDKERLINYPSHIDSNIYAYYSKKIEEKYEFFLQNNNLIDSVLAFRKIVIERNGEEISQCNIHFSKNVFDEISDRKDCLVICLDISKFFDNLNHIFLKEKLKKILDLDSKELPEDYYKVYKSLTKYSYVEKKKLYEKLGLSINSKKKNGKDRLCTVQEFRTVVRGQNIIKKNLRNKGIPQGSPISGLLSNIYMSDFDKNVIEKLEEIDGKYFRYCDDMLFIINENEEQNLMLFLLGEISKLNLNINQSKTQIIKFVNGKVDKNHGVSGFRNPDKLQYLGILYDGENFFLRETGISKYYYKMRKAIRMRASHFNKLKSNNEITSQKIYMRNLHKRFTYIGNRNYISYVYRAEKVFNNNNLKKQIRGHYNVFTDYLSRKIV